MGQVGTITIGGVTYPVFKYTVELTGVGTPTVVIKDTADSRLAPIAADAVSAVEFDQGGYWLAI
jgi:hypothetical protein